MGTSAEVIVVFLVVESSQTVRESLCFVLLTFGVRGVPCSDRKAAMDALGASPAVDGAIVDIDNKDVEGLQLITELKGGESTRRMTVIVHTVQTSRDTVMRMVELGVAGYLMKPFDPDTAKARLASIFAKLATHNSQRRHIRVRPDPGELARVSFRIGRSKQITSGRIVDISLGGMAAELFNPPEGDSIAPGTPVSRMELALAGTVLSPSASVVMYKLKVLAVRFDILAPADKKALERYIFKSISS